jgi:hypothetical protein
MNDPVHPARSRADQLLFAAAAAGFAIALFDFFWSGNGIHGTVGALLVVISTALMAAATGSFLFAAMPRWLCVTLVVLIVLDIVGTALAAYMLEADILLAVMGLMFIGWAAQRVGALTVRRGSPESVGSR